MPDEQSVLMLRHYLRGFVRTIPAEMLVEELALAFTDEVMRQIQPPNQPTMKDCKDLAIKDKLAYRLHQTLLRD